MNNVQPLHVMDHSKGAALNHQPPQIIHSREVLLAFDGTKVRGYKTIEDLSSKAARYETWYIGSRLHEIPHAVRDDKPIFIEMRRFRYINVIHSVSRRYNDKQVRRRNDK